MADIGKLCAQLDSLAGDVPKDEDSRKKLMEAARRLSVALEKPGDTIQRICYLPLQLTVARVSNATGLFGEITKHASASTVEIAEKCKIDPILLGRILRYCSSHGMVKELPDGTWGPTNITKALTIPGIKAGIDHNFETVMPCFQALPQFLIDTDFQNPSDGAKGPFQRAHNTDLPPFVWILDHPFNFSVFNQFMTAQREGQPIWLDVFPFEKLLGQNTGPETPLFVDVGGGVGHQCAALKTRLPHVPGRVILQDQAQMLPQALPTPGVEPMGHDFWTPQPIKGARAYYMRNIMHDYPDNLCLKILESIKSAMAADSVILIDEMMLPNQGTHWLAATLDLMVMSSLGAMERTEKQWQELLNKAGMRIREVFTYTEELRDSVMVVVPK